MRCWSLGLTGVALGVGISLTPARADLLVSGPTSGAGSYSTAQLAALATAGDTVTSGGLTGISLWGLLGGDAGITTTTPSGYNDKNAILRYYLVGSGGGQASVVSVGEINPGFGGTGPTPSFIAFQSGSTLLTTPELIVSGQPARDLTTLDSLNLTSVAAQPKTTAVPSTTVTLTGSVTHPGGYSLADLEALTPVTQTTVSGTTYTGTPLASFVDATGNVPTTIVNTIGTDGYDVVLALAELDPSVGGNPQDILAYASTGTDFPASGVARTLLPNDNKHGRWISNLYAVEVTDVPEPASIFVLAAGLGALGLARRGVRRQHA